MTIKNRIGLILASAGLALVIGKAEAEGINSRVGASRNTDKTYSLSINVLGDRSLGPINTVGLTFSGSGKIPAPDKSVLLNGGNSRASYGIIFGAGLGSNERDRMEPAFGLETYKDLSKGFYASVRGDICGNRKSIGVGVGRRF